MRQLAKCQCAGWPNGMRAYNYTLLPQGMGSHAIFSVEMVDIDQDGYLDVIAGGHEWGFNSFPIHIWINPGSYDFSNVEPLIIPTVPNEGVVLDFTVTHNNDETDIWINRSSGGDGTFYESAVVQKVSWATLESSIVYNERPASWIMSLYPMNYDGQDILTPDSIELAGISIDIGN